MENKRSKRGKESKPKNENIRISENIRLKFEAWEQDEVGLKENIELKDIKSNQMLTGSKAEKHQPFGQGVSKKAIRKQKIREAKEGTSQSQKNVIVSSSATQNSDLSSPEPAEKKMRSSPYQEPVKSLESISQPLGEGVQDFKQLPGCLLSPPLPPKSNAIVIQIANACQLPSPHHR